jgi:anti-sigma regulatory factor (Ser/Thr protein kinase)/ActR/RegA family two-component response regulator
MSAQEPRILLIEPDPVLGAALRADPSLEGCSFDDANGEAEALRRLRRRAYDLIITSPRSSIGEDLALLPEVRAVRPGVKTILLAPSATPEEVIASLRAHVFAVFAAPHDAAEVALMAKRAIETFSWRDGIEVRSAQPDWLTLRVNCRLIAAERVVAFLHELRPEVPESERDEAMMGFREILLNAMEHGGRFDPDKVVEVAAVRTERTIVYYVKDPGPGFRPEEVDHAASGEEGVDPVAHMDKRLDQGLRPGGFGILMAKNVVDELIYSEHGNEVILIKHLGTQVAASPVAGTSTQEAALRKNGA